MTYLENLEVWFVAGSQKLYGERPLAEIQANASAISSQIGESPYIPVSIKFQGVLTTAGEITDIFRKASDDDRCIGLICWMHTFSPARMWINGLKNLTKPILHLHTQKNSAIPWETIDMDYMNLHQSAHGGREFGFICQRLGVSRKVVSGHCSDEKVQQRIGSWIRAASGWNKMQSMRVARFGDNMRDVAVTEGDKVEAQIRLGFEVNGYGLGDLVESVDPLFTTINSISLRFNFCEKFFKRIGRLLDSL